MTGRPYTQRLAERLIHRACRRLPGGTGDERYREWAAELPAILRDPGVRLPLLRSARALSYAAGTYRSARYLRRAAAHPPSSPRRKAPTRAPLPAPGSVLGLHPSPVAGIWAGRRLLARFTDRAAASIFFAQEEARRLGHDHIDPEHILLGLIHGGQGVAVESLTRLGIDLDTLRQQVEESAGHGPGAPAGRPIRPSRPRGIKVLDSALPEALGRGHNYIGTEHLLLAQFHDDGPAAQALARLGASEGEVRAAITAVLAERRPPGGGTETPRRVRVRKDATGDEAERLRREAARLRELLRRHGIDPGGRGQLDT